MFPGVMLSLQPKQVEIEVEVGVEVVNCSACGWLKWKALRFLPGDSIFFSF